MVLYVLKTWSTNKIDIGLYIYIYIYVYIRPSILTAQQNTLAKLTVTVNRCLESVIEFWPVYTKNFGAYSLSSFFNHSNKTSTSVFAGRIFDCSQYMISWLYTSDVNFNIHTGVEKEELKVTYTEFHHSWNRNIVPNSPESPKLQHDNASICLRLC